MTRRRARAQEKRAKGLVSDIVTSTTSSTTPKHAIWICLKIKKKPLLIPNAPQEQSFPKDADLEERVQKAEAEADLRDGSQLAGQSENPTWGLQILETCFL